MINVKPPEEPFEGLDELMREKKISDMSRFMNLFDIVGIEYEQQGNELWIDANYSDGRDGFIVKFYDDDSFKEFGDISPRDIELHEIRKILKGILGEMRKRK